MKFSKQRGFVGNAVHHVLAMRARTVAASFTAEDLLPYLAARWSCWCSRSRSQRLSLVQPDDSRDHVHDACGSPWVTGWLPLRLHDDGRRHADIWSSTRMASPSWCAGLCACSEAATDPPVHELQEGACWEEHIAKMVRDGYYTTARAEDA
jgi:hypothetical protein